MSNQDQNPHSRHLKLLRPKRSTGLALCLLIGASTIGLYLSGKTDSWHNPFKKQSAIPQPNAIYTNRPQTEAEKAAARMLDQHNATGQPILGDAVYTPVSSATLPTLEKGVDAMTARLQPLEASIKVLDDSVALCNAYWQGKGLLDKKALLQTLASHRQLIAQQTQAIEAWPPDLAQKLCECKFSSIEYLKDIQHTFKGYALICQSRLMLLEELVNSDAVPVPGGDEKLSMALESNALALRHIAFIPFNLAFVPVNPETMAEQLERVRPQIPRITSDFIKWISEMQAVSTQALLVQEDFYNSGNRLHEALQPYHIDLRKMELKLRESLDDQHQAQS